MIEESRKIYYREDLEYSRSRLTIERQLQMYEKHPDGNERAATLWHAWQQNKRWLIRLLELTLASFPSYSRHDSSHADAVLHNIERIMGERRIEQLSATDCFAILHTVYIHDIGMAILADDRKNIFESDEFVEMIDDLANGADKDLKNAALLLKRNSYCQESDKEIDYEGLVYHNEKKTLYMKKLDTYYAVVQLLAEYQRRSHGEKAASNVKDWILDQNKLRSEFTMSGVPMRIFFRIADCAALHTDWDFNHILELPWEENGYDNDMLHPRFVAVLLQLGDALDIDNDRFHPFAHAFAGSFPMQSQSHYNKHLAIRTLKITPEEIIIEADCETREAMRLVRNECDGIESLLKSASYHWSRIAPYGFSGALPSFKPVNLYLSGKKIPWDIVLIPFRNSQHNAILFLQGSSAYPGNFLCVRELLQNAIDATKLQCYRDYASSFKFHYMNKQTKAYKLRFNDAWNTIRPCEFPIEIVISCGRLKENGDYEEIYLTEIPEEVEENDKYGVCFSIKDCGIGISRENVLDISNIGTSYKRRKKLLREMPVWFRPAGEFGVGLQSVFCVNNHFLCETHVRNGERYKIEFFSGTDERDGFISAEPKDPEEEPKAYGTEFKIFISHRKRKESPDTCTGHDPFAKGYETSQIRRNIIALTIQILLDIDSQLEDLLFPVFVSVKFDLGKEQKELLKSKLSKVVFDNLEEDEKKYTEDNLKQHMCWIYQNNNGKQEEDVVKFGIENGVCRVDLTQMKIYLWLEDIAVSACLGVDFVVGDNFQSIQSLCKFYYKGIFIAERNINKSGNLLEYINIQGGRGGKKLIQLSRNGFTQEGLDYIDATVIPRIYRNLFDVLRRLAGQEFLTKENQVRPFSEKVKENIEKSLEIFLGEKSQSSEYTNVVSGKNWQKQLIGISLYYNFYMRESQKKDSIYLSKQEAYEREQWNQAIKNVSEAVGKRRTDAMEIHSRLVVTEVYADLSRNAFTVLGKKEITIADFYKKENKFAVASSRRDTGDKWINSLIWLKNQEDTKKVPPVLVNLLETAIPERNRLQGWAEHLEDWADFMLENISRILEIPQIQQSNFVLALLQSVSISACFADITGNLKIHILSGQPLSSVYYNTHAKYKLLKRMERRKNTTNAERFAGNVWMGYELLKTPVILEDVCNIKEQYIQEGEAFMIYPCSGESIRRLIHLAEEDEEKYWADKKREGGSWGKLAAYLIEMKNVLRKMAEMLYSCIVIEYDQVKESSEELFIENYVNHCRTKRVRISEVSYWYSLNSGYRTMLGTLLQEEVRKRAAEEKRDSWKEISVNSLEVEKLESMVRNRLPKEDLIDILRGIIGICILDNSEAFFEGEELLGEKGADLRGYMDTLKKYCFEWEWLWNLVEHLQINLKIQEIKRDILEGSSANDNLVEWISLQTHSEQYGVAECYDRIWDELINAVLQRREGNIKDQHFKLLDWMRKKEENMER